MNGKKAKALRRQEKALGQEKLAFQEMLRGDTVRPAVIDGDGGVGVITITPRTPDELVTTASTEAETEVHIRTGLSVMFDLDLVSVRRAAKTLGNPPSAEELDRLHESVNGPEYYGRLGSMGNNPLYKVYDSCSDRGVVIPDTTVVIHPDVILNPALLEVRPTKRDKG